MYSIPFNLLWLIPLFPLLGAIINGAIGNRIRRQDVALIGTGALLASFAVSVYTFYKLSQLVPGQRSVHQELYKWMVIGNLNISVKLVVDVLSSVMTLIITGIGTLIHIYSAGYMAHDRSPARFFAYLNLFVFSMLILVMGANLPMMFVGWEGVGLCSYLLIGFWYENTANADAGKKAFITNRIGDAGFILGAFLIYYSARTVDFGEIYNLLAVQKVPVPAGVATAVALLLFVGAMGKSAQIPLYVWLPDAMAGPTPVSALIHAATMVTAGVYMIARMYPIFLAAPDAMQFIAWIGALTALFAATIGLVQNDIKKVLAYSTVSQLGFMFLAMGVGAFTAGMLHLMTHAFFKALLFLGSGVVIHAMEHAHGADDPQDMRTMGGLREKMPWTYRAFVIGTLAITGVPFFSGFFSKDDIVWKSFASGLGHPALTVIASLAALCTAFYMFRLLFMTFHGTYRGKEGSFDHLHDPDWRMGLPLVVLAILATFGGLLGVPELIGHSLHVPHIMGQWLSSWFRYAEVPVRTNSHAVEIAIMTLSVALAAVGGTLAWRKYAKGTGFNAATPIPVALQPIHKILLNKYYVDEIWEAAVLRPLRTATDFVLFRLIDRSLVDGTVTGTGRLVQVVGDSLRNVQTGAVTTYLAWLVAALLLGLWMVGV